MTPSQKISVDDAEDYEISCFVEDEWDAVTEAFRVLDRAMGCNAYQPEAFAAWHSAGVLATKVDALKKALHALEAPK